jgi:predicted nucleotidyltransferase
MAMVTDQMLREIVAAAVRAVDPERIILFGSYAHGEAGPDSDLDLLIVERGPLGQGRTRRSELKRLRRALWDFRAPIDILIYTEDEVAAWRDSVNHVIARSLREGRTLYERH